MFEKTEDELDQEFDSFYRKSAKHLSRDEYDKIRSSTLHVKKAKREYKIRKDQFDRYTSYTVKDQKEIFNKLEKITFETDRKNKTTFVFLGNLIFNHIKEFCEKSRLVDEEIIKMISESNILDNEDKKEFETEKKIAVTKKTKSKREGDSTSRDYRLSVQKKLYILLLKIQHEVMGFRMRLGMIFYNYVKEENSKNNLINRYLLFRIEQYVSEDYIEVEEDDDD